MRDRKKRDDLDSRKAGELTALAGQSFFLALITLLLVVLPLASPVRWTAVVVFVVAAAGGVWLTVRAVRARAAFTRAAVRLMEEEDAEKSGATDDTQPG